LVVPPLQTLPGQKAVLPAAVTHRATPLPFARGGRWQFDQK
jgi:hypothetical protein